MKERRHARMGKLPINPGKSDKWKEAVRAFNGGLTNYAQAARRRMKQLRVARVL